MLIADVVFDLPVSHPFSYAVPGRLLVAPGQRVLAPLGGATRPGLVVAVREAMPMAEKPLTRVLEPEPILSGSQLELCRWIAAESCSSLGATCAGLLPPLFRGASPPPPPAWGGGPGAVPELLVGPHRDDRTRAEIAAHPGGVLVLTAGVSTAAEWAGRLATLGPVVRLDSGVTDAERGQGWSALTSGRARIAVGTRSALLAPLPPPALVVLVDEHDPAHKPPGAPRIHARDVVLRRAVLEGGRVLLPSATPSVEMWWRADRGLARLRATDPGTWPQVSVVDTRGMLRADPLTPALARAAHDALASGRRICLLLSRLASALACEDCGSVVRCPACAIPLSFSRLDRTLTCRFCGRRDPVSETCPGCDGRRLTPFGWGVERVELALRRRFPRARIARYDPDATRGARLTTQRREAGAADIVIGTRGALRLFAPASLGLVGVVTLDQFLRIADFRAGERAFALLWSAAERLDPTGCLVIQSQNPEHYAVRAVANQDHALFYGPELRFRAELGYPPFRRLCRVTVRARSEPDARALAEVTARRIEKAGPVTVYPALPDRRGLVWRIIVKGPAELSRLVAGALAEPGRRPRSRGIIEIEMDPVE